MAALLVVVSGKLQAKERSTRFQLAMELYSSTSTLAVIELEVNRYGEDWKKKKIWNLGQIYVRKSRILPHLKHWGLCVVGHDQAEVGAVLLVIVFLLHLWRKLLRSNCGFKVVALVAVFYGDVEMTVVAGGSNGR